MAPPGGVLGPGVCVDWVHDPQSRVVDYGTPLSTSVRPITCRTVDAGQRGSRGARRLPAIHHQVRTRVTLPARIHRHPRTWAHVTTAVKQSTDFLIINCARKRLMSHYTNGGNRMLHCLLLFYLFYVSFVNVSRV